MGIISKLKSFLGGGADRGTPVAVEREPEAADERAVKGLDEEIDHRLPDEAADAEAAPADDDGEPVDAIKGIGPAYAETLADAGVETVEQLAGADAEALADATGLGAGRVGEWIERAKARSG